MDETLGEKYDMAAEDLLNDGERQALTPKVIRKRAEAVLSIAQLAEVLDLSHEARGELVEKVRTIVNGVDGKMPRKLTEAAKNLISVLSDVDEYRIPTPLAIEASGQVQEPAPVEELELVAQPLSQSEGQQSLATDVIDTSVPLQPQDEDVMADNVEQQRPPEALLSFPTRFLRGIIGESKEQRELHTADAPTIAKALLALRGTYRHHKRSADYETLLVDIFSNIRRSELLEKHSITDSNLSQWMYNFKAAILAKYSQEAATQIFDKFLTTQEDSGQAVTETLVDAESITVAEEKEDEPETLEVAAQAAQWNHISLGDALAELLSLDKPSTTSLKEFLNPDITNTTISKYKREALTALVNYVNRTFDGLDDPRLNLDPQQKAALRQLTGAWYKGDVNADPVSVALMIRKGSGHTSRDFVVQRVYSALDVVLAQNRQGEGEPAEEVAPEQEVSAEPQTREERLAQAKKEIVKLVTGLGMKLHKAEVLWQHIHFDEEGRYKEDSPNLRVMLQALQQRLARFGSSKFEDNPEGGIGVRKLVFTGMGFNTLDTVYESLVAQNPTLTKEECEQLVINAVIELLQ